MDIVFWLIALILIVFGAIKLYARDFLWGFVLIVVALLVIAVGPGFHAFQ
jgi:hypothetical protein